MKVDILNGWNTLAIKANELSLLIQTCDNYEWFWSGIFCTLDLYWDFKYPVYFASEEKNPHNLTYHFDSNYKPNPNIISIQHIKSENSDGFSTRMIDAINKIDSKYVLYIQEDMWLKRSLDNQLLNDFNKHPGEIEDKNKIVVKYNHKVATIENPKEIMLIAKVVAIFTFKDGKIIDAYLISQPN